MASLFCSTLVVVPITGSTRTGCVSSSAGAAYATFLPCSGSLVDPSVTGCPQFVQKPVPGSSLVPHDVQKGFGEVVCTAVSAAGGAATATAGAACATGAGSASSRLPHSVQKTEPGSACAPQEGQTGRATVTAAEGCAAAGIGLPHDVQKLADSST